MFDLILEHISASFIDAKPSPPFYSACERQKINVVKAVPLKVDLRILVIADPFHVTCLGIGSPPVSGFLSLVT